MRGQILGGDNIHMLIAIFSKVMRVSTRADVSSASSIEQSAMYSRRGRGGGRGRGREFGGGHDSFETGHIFTGKR